MRQKPSLRSVFAGLTIFGCLQFAYYLSIRYQQSEYGNLPQIAVLIITAVRPLGVANLLQQLIRFRPSASQFPIVVSQDGNLTELTEAVERFISQNEGVQFIQHERREEAVAEYVGPSDKDNARVAQHYKWALDMVFYEMRYEVVVAIEDDLDIAEDFFSYFAATQHLLFTDPSIWCISAWNDNGAAVDLKHSERLYRTDCFPPGYGFMIRRELWIDELSATWPRTNWDDGLRRPEMRNERACIRPEVSRTFHNMTVAGVRVNSDYLTDYFKSTYLPEKLVDFSALDLRYLEKANYDAELVRRLRAAEEITLEDLLSFSTTHKTKEGHSIATTSNYRVVYNSPAEFYQLADAFNLANDIRNGMPRTAYYGVVTFSVPDKGIIVYAVHSNAHLGAEINGEFGSELSNRVYNLSWGFNF